MKSSIKFLLHIAIICNLFVLTANAASNDSIFMSIPTAKNPQQEQTINLIKTYYEAFNKKDMTQFFSIISDNVDHDVNQGAADEKGAQKLKTYMEKGIASFNDKFTHIVILVSDDGKYAAARWVDQGVFYKDYSGINIKASNQKYNLNGVQFFEIKDGKISRISTYFNRNEFLKQLQK